MVGKVIYNLLTTSTELTALISGKVFPLISEDETIINYIVYERRSTQPTNTKLKRSTVDVISYDIMIFTDGVEIMNDIALGVRNALDQYKGVNSGLWIDNIVYTGENDEYEPESNVFGKFMSFDVRFNNIYSTLKQPTNLTTTATSTKITLNWDDNAIGETGYKVYRSTNFRDYELITSLGGGIETYEDTDVVIDTIYYYFIVPYNSVGNGYASDVVADKLGGGDIRVTFDNNLIAETSTDLNIDCSTYLNMAILSDNADVNGNWLESGTNLGKPRFVYELDLGAELYYDGTQWQIDLPPPAGITILATAGNEAYPWLATWSGVTVVEGTIEDYCGGGVCADGEFYINLVKVADVPSGGNASTFVTLDGVNAGTYDPINNIWEVVSDPCADATYTIKDRDETTLYSGSIASGGDLQQYIENTTVEVNDTSFADVPAQGYLNIPVEYENGTPVGTINAGVVEIPNPITQSGIAYQIPLPTGQLTSYRTGDDRWRQLNLPAPANPAYPLYYQQLDFSAANPFVTLLYNNIHANKDRFTDRDGNQTYTTGIVQDHLTRLEVTLVPLGTNDWNGCVDGALGLSFGGNDDWFLGDTNIYNAVVNYDVSRNLNYAPFSLNVDRVFFTSTTDSRNTANAIQFNNATNANYDTSGAKTLTTRYYLAFRWF
jgi:hypothetical protein